jgi:hypothetical protein
MSTSSTSRVRGQDVQGQKSFSTCGAPEADQAKERFKAYEKANKSAKKQKTDKTDKTDKSDKSYKSDGAAAKGRKREGGQGKHVDSLSRGQPHGSWPVGLQEVLRERW